MVEKISKMISNLKVLSKMNDIIDGLNTHATNTNNPHNVTAEQLGLATAYVYKGSVANFSDLPTNAQNGWVYSVENEHTDSSGVVHPAGANFAWDGSKWDDLGGSLSGYVKSVNSQTPDNKGNVFLNLVQSLEKNTEDKLIVHNADGTIQELELGKNYDNDLNNILDSITELETRVVPIEKGGTGATTAENARKNLGLGSVATLNTVPIAQGGTGATTVAGARTNLGLATVASSGSYNDLSNKPTIPSRYITSKYQSGTGWYEVYNDGWVRQGGLATAQNTTYTFLKPFKDTNFSFTTGLHQFFNNHNQGVTIKSLTATNFQLNMWYGEAGSGNGNTRWVAEGYGA